MSRKFLLQAGFSLLLAAAACLWLLMVQVPVLDEQVTERARVSAWGEPVRELTQSFVAPADNLSRIDLRLGSYPPVARGGLLFQLIDEQASPDAASRFIREQHLPPGDYASHEMTRVEFEPVSGSRGREYVIRLSSEDSACWRDGIAVTESDVYEEGGLVIDGQPRDFDLNFALYHAASAGELFAARIEPFRPAPFNNPWFFASLFGLGAALFGWLLFELCWPAGPMVEEVPAVLTEPAPEEPEHRPADRQSGGEALP